MTILGLYNSFMSLSKDSQEADTCYQERIIYESLKRKGLPTNDCNPFFFDAFSQKNDFFSAHARAYIIF